MGMVTHLASCFGGADRSGRHIPTSDARRRRCGMFETHSPRSTSIVTRSCRPCHRRAPVPRAYRVSECTARGDASSRSARFRRTFSGDGSRSREGPPPTPTVPSSRAFETYALLSGADGRMFDGEDALGQIASMSLDNQRNLDDDGLFLKVATGRRRIGGPGLPEAAHDCRTVPSSRGSPPGLLRGRAASISTTGTCKTAMVGLPHRSSTRCVRGEQLSARQRLVGRPRSAKVQMAEKRRRGTTSCWCSRPTCGCRWRLFSKHMCSSSRSRPASS